MTFDEIEKKAAETICAYFNNGRSLPDWLVTPDGKRNMVLVITGGEPTLQKNLTAFLSRELDLFKHVQIESNGTVNLEIPAGVTLVCSPKCSEKNGVAVKYLSPTKQILERADCLKFVMSADEASPYNNVPEWAHKWKQDKPNSEIYCSPMNVYNSFPQKIKLLRAEKGTITMAERSTVDEVISFWEPGLLNLTENQSNHEFTAKYCLENGFRLNLQQHLYASMA
jgi:7-carboxy-7-deazaguanine synthase